MMEKKTKNKHIKNKDVGGKTEHTIRNEAVIIDFLLSMVIFSTLIT